MTAISRGRAFWLVAGAFAITMFGTTMPSPLYPEYEARFGFGSLDVTIVYACYAVGVLAALLAFGSSSDLVGRRPVLLGGLGAAATSAVVFLIVSELHSGGLAVLLVGRVLSGLSAGAFTGTATATLSDFSPGNALRASIVAAMANIGGLGLGPLVSGALARYIDHPLQSPFMLDLVLLAV